MFIENECLNTVLNLNILNILSNLFVVQLQGLETMRFFERFADLVTLAINSDFFEPRRFVPCLFHSLLKLDNGWNFDGSTPRSPLQCLIRDSSRSYRCTNARTISGRVKSYCPLSAARRDFDDSEHTSPADIVHLLTALSRGTVKYKVQPFWRKPFSPQRNMNNVIILHLHIKKYNINLITNFLRRRDTKEQQPERFTVATVKMLLILLQLQFSNYQTQIGYICALP